MADRISEKNWLQRKFEETRTEVFKNADPENKI